MQLISILSNYVPDVGDFFLMIISVLMSVLTIIGRKQLSQFSNFRKENTVDHLNMEKKLIELQTWAKETNKNKIDPAFKSSEENEKNLIDVRGRIRNHEGRIVRIEKEIK